MIGINIETGGPEELNRKKTGLDISVLLIE